MDVNDVEPGGATLTKSSPRRSKRKREAVNYVPQELDDSLHEKGEVPEGAMASPPPLPTRKRRTRKKVNPVGDVPMELDDTPHKEGQGMEGGSGPMPTVSLTPPAKRKRRKKLVVNAAVDIPMDIDYDPPHEEAGEVEVESVHGVDSVLDAPSQPSDPPQEGGSDGETEVESANASVESTTPPPPPRRSARARGTVNYVVDVPLDLDDF